MTLASDRRAAVERAFPGVVCKRVTFERRALEPHHVGYGKLPGNLSFRLAMCVEAPADVLIAHGLVKRKDIDSLPPSGKRSDLRRTETGYQARVWWTEWLEEPTLARDMAARIGLTYQPKAQQRALKVRGGCIRWTTTGNVIRPDWDWLRQKVTLARMEAQA